MGKILDNGQFDTSPCTPEDLLEQWPYVITVIQNIQTTIEEGGAGDTYKVAVNATHASGGTPDFLHAVVDGSEADGTYDFEAHGLVRSNTVADATEQFYWRPDDIQNYANPGTFMLIINDGQLTWTSIGGVIDSFQVKVSNNDTTEGFLLNKIHTTGAIVAGADLLVSATAQVNDGGDEDLKLAVDVSEIDGYTDPGVLLLGIEDNLSKYFEVGALLAANITAGTYIDIAAGVVSVDLTEISAYSGAATQIPGHVSSTFQYKTVVEWLKTLSGYVHGNNQVLQHTANNDPVWQNTGDCES